MFNERKIKPENKLISDLHVDALTPSIQRNVGEYDLKNFPERLDPSKMSVIERLNQFFEIDTVEELLGKRVNELTNEEYDRIITMAILTRYDTVVSSVFDRYALGKDTGVIEYQDRVKKMFELFNRYESIAQKPGITLIKDNTDFNEKGGNLVLTLETGAHLIRSLEDVDILIESGIRIFGLQYGTDNDIASKELGLSAFGKRLVRYLFQNNMIIDLAHSHKKTRQDIYEMAEHHGCGHLVSYTHGATYDDVLDSLWREKLIDSERLLTAEEVKRIARMGGIVGLGVTQPFFANTLKLAERIDKIAQINGSVKSIAIGSDFGGVSPAMLNEIKSVKDIPVILADVLSVTFNMSDEDIDDVIKNNARNWIKNALIRN